MADATQKPVGEMNEEERTELIKVLFSSLEIDKRAVVADWCHENIKTGGGEYMAKKFQKMNDDMCRMLANAQDKIIDAGKTIYHKTNDAFGPSTENISGKSELFD